jgi:hypothetical protein
MKNNFDIYEWRSKYAKKELKESNIRGLMSTSSKGAQAKANGKSLNENNLGHAEVRKVEKNLSLAQKEELSKLIKSGKIKTSDDLKNWLSSIKESINEQEEDPIDIVTMDVPLFIRILEYAKEDAQEDMDLHDLAEKAIEATKQQGILQMDDYDMLVGGKESNDVEKIKEMLNQIEEKNPGLWANINAKQKRGEKPAHGNSNAFKSAVKAGNRINKVK